MIDYVSSLLRRKNYEKGHWDGVITIYKEYAQPYELWPSSIQSVCSRLQSLISRSQCRDVKFMDPHILDLHPRGFISELIHYY